MVVDVLEDVFSRAGASDTDREAWLAERRNGVTATEVRELYLGRKRGALLDEKRGLAVAPFVDNKFTAWGRTREPVIAEWVRERFGIEPESRVFHAAGNSRHLASPDGIGMVDGRLVLAEIKTSGTSKAPGTAAFEKSGYGVQMQWQMYVTGAERCLYVVETHDGDWRPRGGRFDEPVPLAWGAACDPDTWWVERDDALIADLVAVADDFLDEVERPRLDTTVFDGALADYLAAVADEKAAKARADKAKALMAELVGGPGSVARPAGTVSVSGPSLSVVFDSKALKAAKPDVWAEFAVKQVRSGSVRVTPAKEGK